MTLLTKTKSLAAAACLLGAVNSFAYMGDSGPYIGVGFGSSAYNDNGMLDDYSYFDATDYSLDDTAAGFRLYGGYKFNPVVSIEGAYTNYGEFTIHDNYQYYFNSLSFTPTSLSLSANLGYDFLDGQLRPFGIIGMSYVDLDNLNGLNHWFVSNDSSMGLHIGFGVEYNPWALNGFGFRLAYEGDIFEVDTDYGYTGYIEDHYIQSVGMLYLGAHFRF